MSGTTSLKTKAERLFPGQHEDEAVDFVFRQHPLVMRKQLLLGMFALVLAVLPFDFPFAFSSPGVTHWLLIGAGAVVLGVFYMWFHRWIGWYYTIYIVTNRRIVAIRQRGFFARKVDEWQLNNISNVNYEIGGLQAVLFQFGTITAKSYLGDFEITSVHRPAEIHAQLLEAVRRGGGGSTAPGD